MRQYPARVPYSKWEAMQKSGTPWTTCTISWMDSFRSSPSPTKSSAPSSTLTTNETARRAPPGHFGSGGLPR